MKSIKMAILLWYIFLLSVFAGKVIIRYLKWIVSYMVIFDLFCCISLRSMGLVGRDQMYYFKWQLNCRFQHVFDFNIGGFQCRKMEDNSFTGISLHGNPLYKISDLIGCININFIHSLHLSVIEN